LFKYGCEQIDIPLSLFRNEGDYTEHSVEFFVFDERTDQASASDNVSTELVISDSLRAPKPNRR